MVYNTILYFAMSINYESITYSTILATPIAIHILSHYQDLQQQNLELESEN